MTRSTVRLAFALGEQMVVSGASLLVGIVVVRALGIAPYGLFAVLWTIVQFAQALVSSVIIAPFVQSFHASAPSERQQLVSANYARACLLSAVFAVVIGVGGSIASALVPGQWNAATTWCLLLWCCMTCLADAARRHLYAAGQVGLSAIVAGIAYGAQPLFLWWSAPTGVPSVLLVLTGCCTAGALVGLVLLRPWVWSRTAIQENLRATARSAYWLGGASVLQWIAANSVTWLATAMFGFGLAGTLRAAQNIVGPVGIFFQAMDGFLIAEAARKAQNDGPSAMNRYLVRIGMLQLLLGGVLLAAIAWQAPNLVQLVYARTDPELVLGLRCFALFYWVCCLANPVVAWVRVARREPLLVMGQVANIVATGGLVVLLAHTASEVVLLMAFGQLLFLAPQYWGWLRERSPH